MLSKFRFWRRFRGRHRRIFLFDDGSRVRRVDPLRVAQALALHPLYRPDHLSRAEGGDVIAQQITAQAARDVFEVPAWDGDTCRGLTDTELISLMAAFDAYLAALKKNTRHSPTSPPRSAPMPPGSNGENTSGSSPSGSTANGPPFGQPKRSGWARSPA